MKIKGLRWWIVGLIALAAIINYIDRQALSVLWPEQMGPKLYPDATDDELKTIYGQISTIFIISYAFGQAIFGKIFDWIGTRLGFALSIGAWSIATALHAFAQGFASFAIFRSLLGVAEAGNWPGAAKGNAEWFPTKERAFAQGIFNSGASIGGLISIPLIAIMAGFFSWQMVFITIGGLGLLWLIPWLYLVKAPPKGHPMLTEEEKEYILSGQQNQDIDGDGEYDDGYNPDTLKLLSHRQSWGIIIASAAIDPIWWLFVIWIPQYLFDAYGMDTAEIGKYGWVPYVGAMVGAWFGGLLAQNRLKSGWSVDKTRKMVITLGCFIMLPALLALSNPGTPIVAVIIMAVILFGFQIAVGNVQTLPSDFFSGKTVGTLSGFAGMAAKFTAAGLTASIAWLTMGGNYTNAFILGAGLVLLALFGVWVLCGKIEPLSPKTNSNI